MGSRTARLLLVFSFVAFGGEKERLGRQLFFDKRLSVNDSLSCASCHRPDRAFTDGATVSKGIDGKTNLLNAPSVLNRAKAKRFFWDGRAPSLEKQAEGPLLSALEMGNTRSGLEEKLNSLPEYRKQFAKAFGDPAITLERVTQALAAYQKTLASQSCLYDDWKRGRRDKWTVEHEFGRQLFFGTAGCANCHNGPQFTNDALVADDRGKSWKVPSLRESLRTAPYFHDGRYASLEEVLRNHGDAKNFEDSARRALLLFLESLTGDYSR
jgi:cytochrome c peroxidase